MWCSPSAVETLLAMSKVTSHLWYKRTRSFLCPSGNSFLQTKLLRWGMPIYMLNDINIIPFLFHVKLTDHIFAKWTTIKDIKFNTAPLWIYPSSSVQRLPMNLIQWQSVPTDVGIALHRTTPKNRISKLRPHSFFQTYNPIIPLCVMTGWCRFRHAIYMTVI